MKLREETPISQDNYVFAKFCCDRKIQENGLRSRAGVKKNHQEFTGKIGKRGPGRRQLVQHPLSLYSNVQKRTLQTSRIECGERVNALH